jgi:hypothetical protein
MNDAKELAYKIRETVENIGIMIYPESVLSLEDSALLIQQYAESYHAKKCAECWRVPRVMCSICGDPIIVGGVCENCVPDMFNDANTPKTGCTK